MSETNLFRLIEAYFDGSINPNDRLMLENKIKTDPLLKAEFDLQKNIVSGITNARKQALKNRLAAIDVGSGVSLFTGHGAKWLAATFTAVTIFGSILYWSMYTNDLIKPIDLSVDDKIEFDQNSIVNVPTASSFVSNKSSDDNQKSIEPIVTIKVKREVESVKKDIIDSKTAIVKPQSLLSFEDNEIFAADDEKDIKNASTIKIENSDVSKTEIELLENIEDAEQYHYRYFNSKLYLYGDFKKQPYEIIELNNKGKKQLFLSYSDHIYIIEDNVLEITALEKLEDEMLEMEIRLIIQE